MEQVFLFHKKSLRWWEYVSCHQHSSRFIACVACPSQVRFIKVAVWLNRFEKTSVYILLKLFIRSSSGDFANLSTTKFWYLSACPIITKFWPGLVAAVFSSYFFLCSHQVIFPNVHSEYYLPQFSALKVPRHPVTNGPLNSTSVRSVY